MTTALGIASCADHSQAPTGKSPSSAVAAIVMGPATLPVPEDSRTEIVSFDDAGNQLQHITGRPLNAAKVIGWREGFAAATAQAVTSVTRSGEKSLPVNENILEGAVSRPGGGGIFWFNTAQPDGPTVPYRNNFILVARDGSFESGSIEGTVLTAAHCGASTFAIAANVDSIIAGEANGPHRLYRITHGKKPVVVSEWTSPNNVRPVSPTYMCADGTSYMYSILASQSALAGRGDGGVTLARTNTDTGERSETPIDLAGQSASIATGSNISLIDHRLYWLSKSGSVLSVSTDSRQRQVRTEWQLDKSTSQLRASVKDERLAVFKANGEPSYSEYNLRSGVQILKPIHLPWLKKRLAGIVQGSIQSIADVS